MDDETLPEKLAQVPNPNSVAASDVTEDLAKLGARSCKARLVLLGYGDPDAGQFATYSPTVRRESKAIIYTLAAHRRWRIFSLDARTAFLNGRSSVRPRPLYVQLPADCESYLEREYGEGPGLRALLKSAYGLGEAPFAFFYVLVDDVVIAGFYQMQSDPCLFVLFYKKLSRPGALSSVPADILSLSIVGIIGAHVDDLLCGGNGEDFECAMKQLESFLPFGERRYGNFTYCGDIVTQDPVTFEINTCQSDHSTRLQEVDVSGLAPKSPLEPHHMTSICSICGAARYVTSTRPELAFEISHVASRAKEGATKQELLDVNKLVRRARGDAERGLRFVKLCDDWADLILVIFSDAGWVSRASNHSQAGGLHFLCDKRDS